MSLVIKPICITINSLREEFLYLVTTRFVSFYLLPYYFFSCFYEFPSLSSTMVSFSSDQTLSAYFYFHCLNKYLTNLEIPTMIIVCISRTEWSQNVSSYASIKVKGTLYSLVTTSEADLLQ